MEPTFPAKNSPKGKGYAESQVPRKPKPEHSALTC